MHTILFILKYGTISCSICSFTNVFIFYVKTKPINHSLSTLLFRLWPKPLKRLKSNTQTCLLRKLLYTRKQRSRQSKRWVYNLNWALLFHSTLNPISGQPGIPNFFFRSYSFTTITAVIWSKAWGHRLSVEDHQYHNLECDIVFAQQLYKLYLGLIDRRNQKKEIMICLINPLSTQKGSAIGPYSLLAVR